MDAIHAAVNTKCDPTDLDLVDQCLSVRTRGCVVRGILLPRCFQWVKS